MQVGGEGPEGPHRLGIAAGTDRCHVQGGADVNGGVNGGPGGMDRGNVPRRAGVLPSRHGRHLLWTRWRGGAARKNQFPNRDRLGVTTLKSAAARGPSLVSGSGPPKTGRPLPSAADHSAGCFSRHRRNQFRDRLVAHDLSGYSPEGSHAAGGQNGPDHRCDWVASSEEVELRGGGGAVGDERTALSPAARRL